VSVGVLQPPQWPFIRNGLQANIEKVQNFYRTHNPVVKSNHLLIKLLQSLTVSKQMELERYYDNVDTISLGVSMALKMTSSIYRGIVHRGIFYGKDNPEIILAVDDYFDFNYVHQNWEKVSAVKPLLHPKSDFDYMLPRGIDTSDENGLAVIMVNIPMLAVQYRAFLLSQWQDEDESPKSINQFIGGFVLPNMLRAQTELCLFNKIYNRALFPDIEVFNKPYIKHTFALLNVNTQLNNVIDKYILYARQSNQHFATVLKTLPSIYNANMYESLLMPDIAPTRQVDSTLVLTRLKMVDFLFDICKEHLLSRNQVEINQILRSFRLHDVYTSFKEYLPVDVLFETQSYIDDILLDAKRVTF
jgi:hypothetical protein